VSHLAPKRMVCYYSCCPSSTSKYESRPGVGTTAATLVGKKVSVPHGGISAANAMQVAPEKSDFYWRGQREHRCRGRRFERIRPSAWRVGADITTNVALKP
jgi:hypothetical protein